MGRHAAALLGGAAAVHFADLLFHAGLAAGVSGLGQGRALVVFAAVLPALLFAWLFWDRSLGCATFLLGACAGYAADEWLLLPLLGFWWTTAIWVVPAAAAALVRGRPEKTPAAGRGLVLCGGALAAGVVIGFALALVRPFLFQHVAGTRHGLRIAVETGLVGLFAGAAVGQALRRRLPKWGLATLCALLAGLAFTMAMLVFPKASGGFNLPLLSGAWALTWWGRSIVASWVILGLMTVAFGAVLPVFDRRRAIPFLMLGLAAGTWIAEKDVARLGADPAAARALADDVARHPPLQTITAAAIDPDGLWTRYRTRTVLELENLAFWQATRMDRGELWHNLESAEIEPFGPPQAIFGHVAGELSLTTGGRSLVRAGDEKGDVVLPSFGFLASGLSLRDSVELLEARARASPASLRVWCDPRALTPAGVGSLLATWREALPDGTFSLLFDGYSGPLLGVRVGGAGAHFHVAEQLTLFEAPIASAFRGALGPVSTLARPVLEWEAAPEPSPFVHPRGDVMRRIMDALAIDPESVAGHVMRGLVIHARAQVVRPYVVSAWDHVAVPKDEIDEYMVALRKDERSPVLIQHLQIVFDVLLKKRDLALLVHHAEEAVARRPDVFGFHRTLGNAYSALLDYDNAIEELVLARNLQPQHHDAVMELSRALGAAKRWPEAVLLLEAEQKRSDDPGVLKGLAIALLEAGELARAEQMLREVNAKYPADVDVMRAIDKLEHLKR